MPLLRGVMHNGAHAKAPTPWPGLTLAGLLVWMLLAYPSHRPEIPMLLSDAELADLLGLTPAQAARVPAEFWDAAREFLACP